MATCACGTQLVYTRQVRLSRKVAKLLGKEYTTQTRQVKKTPGEVHGHVACMRLTGELIAGPFFDRIPS